MIYTDKLKITVTSELGEYIKEANDDYGNLQCPFCDNYIAVEKQEINIGLKCWKCKAEINKITTYYE